MNDKPAGNEAVEALETLGRLGVLREPLVQSLAGQVSRDAARAGRSILKALRSEFKTEYRRKWVCTELDAKRRLWVRLGQPLDAQLITGTFEPDNTRLIMSALTSGGTFIDVGTNVGWFSINVGGWYADNGGGQVISVEPIPEVFARLSSSIRLSGLETIVKAHNIAIAGEDGEVAFHVSDHHLAGSHLVSGSAAKAGDIIVQARRASSILDAGWRVDMIKIDIEGAEPGFFTHARDFILSKMPPILSEVHGPKLKLVSGVTAAAYVAQVASLGYTPMLVGKKGRVRPLAEAPPAESDVVNVLFVRPEHLDRFQIAG